MNPARIRRAVVAVRSRTECTASCLALALVLLAALLPGSAPALDAGATTDEAGGSPERPRIGLALGGGGARGVAHVGVLRVLDEMRIPIDYVSGTSMGAIVAALFAMGLTPDEIEAQVLAIDWDDLFSDTPDRFARTYRRKEDDNAFFWPMEFGLVDRTIVSNRGIIAGQKLSFAVTDPDIYTAGHRGFDELAYPLRVVGTDLHTGEMVVLDRGSLLQSVRASMSIPGLFPPVQWQDHELIDGGVVRNLPVDIVREMGADIVIAVDVGVHPEDTDEAVLGTFLGILSQTLTIQGRRNVLDQLVKAEVPIEVDLGDISFKDFERVADTIAPGERAARSHADALGSLAVSPEAYARHLREHRLPDNGPPVIDRIAIRNTSPTSDAVVRRRISQVEGEPLDLDVLKQDLAGIYDLGVSELVDFTVTEVDGETVLTVQPNGKHFAPHIVRAGGSYVGGQQGRTHVNARVRYTWMEINRLGAEWRNDAQLGRIAGIRTEFYQPLAPSRRPFLAVTGKWQESILEWYEDLDLTGEFVRRDFLSLAELGYGLWTAGEIRAGVYLGRMDLNNKSTTPLSEYHGAYGGYTARLRIDVLDNDVFPTRGVAGEGTISLERSGFGSEQSFDRLHAWTEAVFTVKRNTFLFGAEGGSGLGSRLPRREEFSGGGLYRLSGYHPRQVHGQSIGLVSGRWYRPVSDGTGLFSTSWYVGLGAEAGNVWESPGDASLGELRTGFHVALMASTYIGPATLAYGFAGDGHDSIYLLLGSTKDFLN